MNFEVGSVGDTTLAKRLLCVTFYVYIHFYTCRDSKYMNEIIEKLRITDNAYDNSRIIC